MNFFPHMYEMHYFGDFDSWEADGDLISQLLSRFIEHELLPTTYQELTVGSPQQFQSRVKLVSAGGMGPWAIGFERDRIKIVKNIPTIDTEDLGSLEGFVDDALEKLRRCLEIDSINARRISLVGNLMSFESDEAAMISAWEKLVNPIEFYSSKPPIEWGVRQNSRHEWANQAEMLNVISTTNRHQGIVQSPAMTKEFDRLRLGFDINTLSENRVSRFDFDQTAEFMKYASDLGGSLLRETIERISND